MIPVTNKFIQNVTKNSPKMQSRLGMAMDLVSPCIFLKAANPYSSKERCYKLQC